MTAIATNAAGHGGGAVLSHARDYRRTLASLLPAIQAGYILIGFPLIYRGNPAETQVAVEPDYFLNKLIFPVLFMVALALFLAVRPQFHFWRKTPVMLVVTYVALAGLSTVWSLAPDRSFDKFLLLVLALGIPCMAILICGSLERCLKPIFWVVAAAMAINLVVVLLTDPGPIGHQGIYSHKNLLGSYCSLGVAFGLAGMSSRWSVYKAAGLFALVAALLILVQSQSKTSLMLAVMVPALAWGMVFARRHLAVSLPVQAVLVALGLTFAFNVLSTSYGFGIGTISNAIAGEPTFTGRTSLWEFSLDNVAQRPLLGHGYQAFWNIGKAAPSHRAEPGFIHVTPHAHNGYIDTMLELGVIGLVVLVLILLAMFAVVDRIVRERPRIGHLALTLLCLPIFHNMLESTWFSPLEATMACLFLILFTSAVQGLPREPRHDW